MAWTLNGTPVLLTSPSNTLQIADLPPYKFNVFLTHAFGKSTNQGIATTLFGSSGGNDYSQRKSINAAADGTDVNQAGWYDQSVRTDADDSFAIHYIPNVDGALKVAIEYATNRNTSGSAYVPESLKFVGSYDTSTNTGQFIRIDCVGSAGTMAAGTSFLSTGTD